MVAVVVGVPGLLRVTSYGTPNLAASSLDDVLGGGIVRTLLAVGGG
jgi:hypothetical protein